MDYHTDVEVDITQEIKKGYDHYSQEGHNVYFARETTNKLSAIRPGIYQIGYDRMRQQNYIYPTSTKTDGLIDLPDSVSDQILKEVDHFLKLDTKKTFLDYGMLYKRGILLYGAPGTGKTCTIFKTMERVVQDGGMVFFNPNPYQLTDIVRGIREVEPDKNIMVVFEELEDWLDDEESILSLLDGETQLDNIIYIATTNYIDRIPPRLKNRPSRFASVIEVGLPPAETREIYFRHKLINPTEEEIKTLTEATEGLTIDHLKDLIVSVKCFGLDAENAVKKLRGMDGGNGES